MSFCFCLFFWLPFSLRGLLSRLIPVSINSSSFGHVVLWDINQNHAPVSVTPWLWFDGLLWKFLQTSKVPTGQHPPTLMMQWHSFCLNTSYVTEMTVWAWHLKVFRPDTVDQRWWRAHDTTSCLVFSVRRRSPYVNCHIMLNMPLCSRAITCASAQSHNLSR